MKIVYFLICLLLIVGNLNSAPAKVTDSDLVSLGEDTSFDQAVEIFGVFFQKHEAKNLLDLSNFKGNIKVKIDKIQWKAAFLSILMVNNLQFEEKGKIIIIKPAEVKENAVERAEESLNKSEEVLIALTFFEADMDVLNELGIDWTTLTNGNVNFSAKLQNAGKVTQDVLELSFNKTIESGSGTIDIKSLLRIFESNDKGNVISRPQITVTSGEEGYVQDGVNFSIKTMDQAGNVADNFYNTGTIVKVKPVVIPSKDGNKYISLGIDCEKSSATPDAVSTKVKISKAKTQKVLYDGEETVVGGLTSKEERFVRKGVPILKDLPWWFLGIRYITGYSRKDVTTKELLILIKASVLDEVKNRIEEKPELEKDIKSFRDSLPQIEKQLIDRTEKKDKKEKN